MGRSRRRLCTLALALCAVALAAPAGAGAATFTVTSTADTGGTCTATPSACTLRQAINSANESPVADTIAFAIGASGTAQRIQPGTQLPALTAAGGLVTLDGMSQPGYAGSPLVEINGQLAGANADGLRIPSCVCVVRGLSITGFSDDGIEIGTGNAGTFNLVVTANWVGVQPSGLAGANGGDGIVVGGPNNTIGGTTAAERNVISGNLDDGIEVAPATSGTQIRGNYVGTATTGAAAMGNGRAGIELNSPATVGSTVTSPAAPCDQACNVISGNGAATSDDGIEINTGATGTVVRANYVGLNAAGTAALPNTGQGIEISAAGVRVGDGGVPGASRNYIAGNGVYGVWLRSGATGARVQGNYIGLLVSGTAAPAQRQAVGVFVDVAAHDATIGLDTAENPDDNGGDPDTGERNAISGNERNAVVVMNASGVAIRGNHMGTRADGTGPAVPNGIVASDAAIAAISAFGLVVGGTTFVPGTGEGNVIAGNLGAGIDLGASPVGSNPPATIRGNRIGVDTAGGKLANSDDGIRVADGPDPVIGGNIGDGNLISGNSGDGIEVATAHSAATIQGNHIGVGVNGNTALGNAEHGVRALSPGNLIGGAGSAGNVISGNQSVGVFIDGASGNRVHGNRIGMGANGTTAVGNAHGVVVLDAPDTEIGGKLEASWLASQPCDHICNLISANDVTGVTVAESPGGTAAGTFIAGNYIGTDRTGVADRSNASSGVSIQAADVVVGGAAHGYRNLISGSATRHVFSLAARTIVLGNYIGTDWDGLEPVGAVTQRGVEVRGPGARIGGPTAPERNVIIGAEVGVHFSGQHADGGSVEGNYIGVNRSATVPSRKNDVGVGIEGADNVVGGATRAHGNVIGGSTDVGLAVFGPNAERNRIVRNWIGTEEEGGPRANGVGVIVAGGASKNVVGGTTPSEGNSIERNDGAAVRVSGDSSTENTVALNRIAANGFGIDLLAAGEADDTPTPNDPLDADVGPNQLQNHPVLSGAWRAGSTIQVAGTLASAPNRSYTLRFSYNSAAGAHTELPLGEAAVVTTNGAGNASFNRALTATDVPTGAAWITVTATDSAGNTSEISPARQVEDRPTVRLSAGSYSVGEAAGVAPVAITRSSGDGSSSVRLSTANLTALAPGDYAAVSQVVSFAAGQTTRTVNVPIVNDTAVEPDETLRLTLSDPFSAVLATPAAATLTIRSDDVGAGGGDGDPTVDPDPEPEPENRRPVSRIGKPAKRLVAPGLRRLKGRASDPDGNLAAVEIALVKLERGARAAAPRPGCRVLRENGRLKRGKPKKGRCRLRFVKATGTARWSFELRRRLPAGRYVLVSRAVDAAGAREKGFSTRRGNRRAFRIVRAR